MYKLSIYRRARGPIIVGPWGPWVPGPAEFDIDRIDFDPPGPQRIHGDGERKFPATVDRSGLWRAAVLKKFLRTFQFLWDSL